MIAAAFVGLWLGRRRWSTLLPVYVTVLVPPIIYLLLFAVPRYHVPLLPIPFLFAADAVMRLPFLRARSPQPIHSNSMRILTARPLVRWTRWPRRLH